MDVSKIVSPRPQGRSWANIKDEIGSVPFVVLIALDRWRYTRASSSGPDHPKRPGGQPMQNQNRRFDSQPGPQATDPDGVSVPAQTDSSVSSPSIDPEATLVEFRQKPASDSGTGLDPDATLVDLDATMAEGTWKAAPPTGPKPFRQQTSVPLLETGDVMAGRYEILQLLGEGGMGAVYKASDRELDRFVALKLIRRELSSNPAIVARFKQELLLSHQVTHKNVIRIYDLGDSDGIKFITMEFVEGEDLRSLILENKKFPPKEAVEIIQQVCRALEAAHGVGVIHRDLKPQNVMRDKTGRILVMDFGMARTFEGDGMTQSGALVGTMEYMSPEQALAKDLDQRSDLFAVGLIFYELLTGKMPYKAESAVASLIKRNQERAIPVTDHDGTIPLPLSNIVSKCLERDPDLRYQTATECFEIARRLGWQSCRGELAFSARRRALGTDRSLATCDRVSLRPYCLPLSDSCSVARFFLVGQ